MGTKEKEILESGPFTVADMKKAIKGLSDDIQIIVGGHDHGSIDWANIELESRPNPDDGIIGLTFRIVDNFDTRQF